MRQKISFPIHAIKHGRVSCPHILIKSCVNNSWRTLRTKSRIHKNKKEYRSLVQCNLFFKKKKYYAFSSLKLHYRQSLIHHFRWSIAAHGNLNNSTYGVSEFLRMGTSETPLTEFLRMGTSETFSAHALRQKISFPIWHGGASLRTGTSKTPLPEFLRMGTSETPFLEFLRRGCTRKLCSL